MSGLGAVGASRPPRGSLEERAISTFLTILAGAGGGAVIVSFAVYFAIRPYLRDDICKPGAARPSKRQDDPTDASQLQDSHPWFGDEA